MLYLPLVWLGTIQKSHFLILHFFKNGRTFFVQNYTALVPCGTHLMTPLFHFKHLRFLSFRK